MASVEITGWPRLIILWIIGALAAAALGYSFSANSRSSGISLRTKVVTYPAAYQLPRIPGGLSLRMAMLHDVLMERYLRHGEAWYGRRNELSRAIIAQEKDRTATASGEPSFNPRMLNAMDDLAVGLENLHQSAEAAEVMREKLRMLAPWKFAPGADALTTEVQEVTRMVDAADLPAEAYQQYTVRANLGTSLIHSSFAAMMAGDAAARGRMEEGLQMIEEAIRINPAAHFGRETWQAIVMRHLLACDGHREMATTYDVIGDEFSKLVPVRARTETLGFSAAAIDDVASIEKRVDLRDRITRVGVSAAWAAVVQPRVAGPVVFDEPALALMGMWMLGGGPNPQSAIALADIALQVGQWEIAWDGYERALEMREALPWDPEVRQKLVAFCQQQQKAIALRESPSPDDWTAAERKRHGEELAWAKKYQDDYHAWEARQIAAGVALDADDFYAGFFNGRPSIASAVGRADEMETRIYSPQGVVDMLPAAVFGGGLCAWAGAMTSQRRRGMRAN